MLRRLALGIWCVSVLPAGQSLAETAQLPTVPVVVELFTSQGCSSCPPADEILAGYADDPNVIALALHVDYWDYLGWKDSFAKSDFTKRQKRYARVAGYKTIYTPQMVVDGSRHIIGAHADELSDEIAIRSQTPHQAVFDLTRDGAQVQITLSTKNASLPDGVIQLVTFKPEEKVRVKRGENAGKTITYSHIVQDWTYLQDVSDSPEHVTIQYEVADDLPLAVLFQAPDFGPIFAAASLR